MRSFYCVMFVAASIFNSIVGQPTAAAIFLVGAGLVVCLK